MVQIFEPRPLRQYDETLPREVERICAKAIAKRANERYQTAFDFAEDLRALLESTESGTVGITRHTDTAILSQASATEQSDREKGSTVDSAKPDSETKPLSDSLAPVIVPKGLHSFDEHDAELRLIAPTDPSGADTADTDVSEPDDDKKFYRLTHDYLIVALRNWLNRKQKGSITFVPLKELSEIKEYKNGQSEDDQVAANPLHATVGEGPFGDTLTFDGNGPAAVVLDEQPNLKDAFSISLWLRLEPYEQYGAVVSKMDPTLKGIDVWIQKNRVALHVKSHWVEDKHDDNRLIKVVADPIVGDGTWHHIVARYDGSGDGDGVTIFVDGKKAVLTFKKTISTVNFRSARHS